MIKLSLNGEAVEFESAPSLAGLLQQREPTGAYAVALNGEFVPKSRYAATQLNDGDQLDIVSPVGGG